MSSTRRTFLTTSAATVAASSTLLPGAFAAGDETLKVGLVGCGGRGTRAAMDALQADKNVKLVAMCDAFMDRLQDSLNVLRKNKVAGPKVDVQPDRCYDGFDGFQKLLASDVNVVLLCTPPGFRPAHLRAAVEAGKHVFCEKPVAVDAPGVRSVVETAKLARSKNVSLCSGFCYRYDQGKRETIRRIHDGMIGDVAAMHITYLTNTPWPPRRSRENCGSDMEYQMRNWYFYTWLSGDFIVEQHCHNFDKAAWVFKGEMPTACYGVGGRQVRTDPKYGNIYDHFGVTFEYKSGAKLFSFCRQTDQCFSEVKDHVIGTRGSAQLMKHTIAVPGEKGWEYGDGAYKDMYQVEHDELFAGIRSGKHINDGESAAYSTLMAILAREAAYTGKKIAFQDMLHSKEDLTPKQYAWGPNPVPAVAMPGSKRFI